MSEWVKRLFATIDEMKADEFVSFFAKDAQFRFGNAKPVVGREGVLNAVKKFFLSIKSLQHDITGQWTGQWEQGNVVSVEAEVSYTRKDGTVVTLPCTSTLRLEGDLIRDYRIYMDISPVFA
ncbi:MAG: nuclear transport factor 2 family protein [Microcoleus sp. SIO2G3]|nr:nuclear transport factor 2 family protein [Microcoleus sp. SIO2G3]